jgi:hypothetical protein
LFVFFLVILVMAPDGTVWQVTCRAAQQKTGWQPKHDNDMGGRIQNSQ